MRALATALVLAGLITGIAVAEDVERHDGSIEVVGHQTMVIENKTLHVAGEIIVRDSAELIIRNATIVFTEIDPSIWNGFARMRAWDTSRIVIEDSKLFVSSSLGRELGIIIRSFDSSTISLDNVSAPRGLLFGSDNGSLQVSSSEVSEIRLWDTSSAFVSASTIRWAVGLDFKGTARVEMANIAPGFFNMFDFPDDFAVDGAVPELVLRECRVGAWSIGAAESADLRLRDCHLDRLVLDLQDPCGSLRGFTPGPIEDWDLTRDNEIDVPLRVRLADTFVHHAVVDFVAGGRDVAVSDSELLQIWADSYSGTLTFTQCSLGVVAGSDSRFSISLQDTSISRGFDLDRCFIYITGDYSVDPEAWIGKWSETGCLRKLNVRVTLPDGTPASDAAVELASPWGDTSTYTTDEGGICPIWISFSDMNIGGEWTISASRAGQASVPMVFGFLTTSPLILQLGE